MRLHVKRTSISLKAALGWAFFVIGAYIALSPLPGEPSVLRSAVAAIDLLAGALMITKYGPVRRVEHVVIEIKD